MLDFWKGLSIQAALVILFHNIRIIGGQIINNNSPIKGIAVTADGLPTTLSADFSWQILVFLIIILYSFISIVWSTVKFRKSLFARGFCVSSIIAIVATFIIFYFYL